MMFKNLLTSSPLALILAAPLVLTACPADDGEAETTGDGDGDTTTGDGDGDTGDGDGDTTGDGDGDTTGDGDGDSAEGDGDGDTMGEATGAVRLVHLGVFPNDENTTVDIFVNGEASGISFSFKEATDYVDLPVGTYDFDVVPSGGAIEDSVYTVADFEIAEGDMWEVFAYGYVAPEDGEPAFAVGALPDNWVDIPAGQNRFNIIHAAGLPALTPIDLWVVDDACEPVQPLLQDFEYGTYAADADLPDAAIKLGFDVGQDGTVDACIGVPALGGDTLANAFAVNDSQGNVSVIAHLADGSAVELLPE